MKAIVKAEPVGGLSSLLLDEAMAAEAPYPCGRCGAFHGNESGYCSACSASRKPASQRSTAKTDAPAPPTHFRRRDSKAGRLSRGNG